MSPGGAGDRVDLRAAATSLTPDGSLVPHSHSKCSTHIADLLVKPGGRAVLLIVDDGEPATGPLALQRPLGGLAPVQFVLIPSPCGADSLESGGSGGVDKNGCIALPVESRFEQQGGVHDHAGRGPAGRLPRHLHRLVPVAANERMNQAFEAEALVFIGEDTAGYFSAIDAAVGADDSRPPPLGERCTDLGPVEDGPGFGVEIDDEESEAREYASDGGLATPDAAGEADDDGLACGAHTEMVARAAIPWAASGSAAPHGGEGQQSGKAHGSAGGERNGIAADFES